MLLKVVTRMNEEESCLRLADVLFSVRILTSNRIWVTSFIISSKQTAVFSRQSIGNARVDGSIWKFTDSARKSRAEPEEKKPHYMVWIHCLGLIQV